MKLWRIYAAFSMTKRGRSREVFRQLCSLMIALAGTWKATAIIISGRKMDFGGLLM
jgi:hypothetical protein